MKMERYIVTQLASFYMIYALLALGHSLQSSMIQKGYSWYNILYMEDGKRESLAKLSFNCMGYGFTQLCVTRGTKFRKITR